MFKTINGGIAPTRASKYSACVDLYSAEDVVIGAGKTAIVPLGVCIDKETLINAIPMNKWVEAKTGTVEAKNKAKKLNIDLFMKSHYLQLEPRSSLRAKGLQAGTGIIDMDYRDEIKLIVHNPTQEHKPYVDASGAICGFTAQPKYIIKRGDRIAQIMLCEHKSGLFGIESEDERTGGIGSSGER